MKCINSMVKYVLKKMMINGFNVIYSQLPIGHIIVDMHFDLLNGKVQMVQTSTCCAGCNSLKSINLEREGKTKMISKYILAAKTHTIQQTACSVTLHYDHVRI